LSNYFIPSTRDKTTSTSLSSHALLLRSGAIRQSGAGIYSLLPLGLRIIEKIERIVDEEMQSIGSQKLSLPILLNPEDWKKTGRWDGAAGEVKKNKEREESVISDTRLVFST
jgi:prolyl-tRNA synthetase